jgi:hypothetical protein
VGDLPGWEWVQHLVAEGPPHEVGALREVEDVAPGRAGDGPAGEGPELGQDAEERRLAAARRGGANQPSSRNMRCVGKCCPGWAG